MTVHLKRRTGLHVDMIILDQSVQAHNFGVAQERLRRDTGIQDAINGETNQMQRVRRTANRRVMHGGPQPGGYREGRHLRQDGEALHDLIDSPEMAASTPAEIVAEFIRRGKEQ